jgi:hypothetical protein
MAEVTSSSLVGSTPIKWRFAGKIQRCARGWLRVGGRVVVPLVPYLLWALVCLVGLPQYFRWSLEGLLLDVPDFGYTLVLSGAIALIWGVLRTVLMILVLRKRGSPKETGTPAKV